MYVYFNQRNYSFMMEFFACSSGANYIIYFAQYQMSWVAFHREGTANKTQNVFIIILYLQNNPW